MFNYTDEYGHPRVSKIAAHALVALFILVTILSTFGTVSAGERGVKTRFRAVVGVLEPGLYVKLPFIEKVTKMDIKTRTVVYDLENPLYAASRDLQDVQIAVVTNYHIDPLQAATIYQQYGTVDTYEASIVRPIVQDTVKAVASNYTAEELVTKRADYNDKVTATLADRLASKFVTIERVNITNFKFSDSFTQAIEAKVTAEQQALAAKNSLERVKFEAQQTIEKAKAEAESIRIQAQAITQQGGAEFVNLKAVEKWDGHLPQQMIPGSAVPFINLNK